MCCLTFFYFSGVEKKNDDFWRFFHGKINRWDAFTSLLLQLKSNRKHFDVVSDIHETTQRGTQLSGMMEGNRSWRGN